MSLGSAAPSTSIPAAVPNAESTPEKKASPKKKARWGRRLAWAAGGTVVGVAALWVAIHEIPGFGPAVADGARSLFGPGFVAWAEDFSYGIADELNQLRHKDDAPVTYWEEPAPSASAVVSADPVAPAPPPTDPPPPAFEPPHPTVATAADGKWIPMQDASGQSPAMYKSLVHPDPKRSFAAVALVAIDRKRVDLHLVAGRTEPSSTTVPMERRPGLVPETAQGELIAAFNGGFKAVHGHWGMKLGGETYLPPRDVGCTVAMMKDGSVRVGTWKDIKESEPDMTWYRQTPPCLVENDATHPALEVEYAKGWGATVSGETVIRRSALGVDATGRFLIFGLGDALTAQSLARAMKQAGAKSAAQLDVNYAYPRFLVYERSAPNEAPKAKTAIIPDIKFRPAEYVGEPALRDFFYLTRKKNES
ncbi:MAG: phosphodiester glycosidase family protein [Polyangiaceae bacterium]|nr:phosphodiester glycosidase family protein [Polyangiaceae bacterium]